MTLRLTILQCLPESIYRRSLLDRLAQATADAFGAAAPDWRGSPFADRLTAYAEYTAAEAAHLASRGAATADARAAARVAERLHHNATVLGAELRRRLGIREPREALAVLELLYRQIGIGIGIRGRVMSDGASTGSGSDARASGGAPSAAGRADIQVTRCFFAHHYCESTCRMMSALDSGVVNGLFGGASLEFSQRITAGSPSCRAVIRAKELQP